MQMDKARKLIEEMNRYYEVRAPWHDLYMDYKSNEDMEERLSAIVGIVGEVVIGKRVLEIACGTGNWTQVLAKRAASVVAIDISPTALTIARSKLSGHENVSLMRGDAYDLDNIGDSFEVLFSADWWSHIPKGMLPAALDSALSTLLPGSKAVFVDMSLGPYFQQEPCFYDKDNNRISLRKLPDGSEFQVVKNFPNESELRETLAPFGRIVNYSEFSALERWMIVLEKT